MFIVYTWCTLDAQHPDQEVVGPFVSAEEANDFKKRACLTRPYNEFRVLEVKDPKTLLEPIRLENTHPEFDP